jgi:ketosteroid isomerase-like protein
VAFHPIGDSSGPPAVLVLVAAAPALPQELPPAQADLVSTERAFAKLAETNGIREAFLEYFADDGIGFGPHPYKVRETLRNSPPPPPSTTILRWAPAYGDVSPSGDLGWNTGPTVFEDTSAAKKPARHGMFFSVWKKQADGRWRVLLDLGADTPAAVVPLDAAYKTSFRPSGAPAAPAGDAQQEVAGLLAAERDFLAAAKAGSVGQAYAARLGQDARIHRPGAMPVVGKDAVRAWLAEQTMTLGGEPIRVDVARSGDLGYAYGRYQLGGPHPQSGYYARVWKRDANRQWRIVMDVVNPAPSGSQPVQPRPDAAPRDPLAQKAFGHFQAQEWAQAATAYQQYLERNPEDPGAWHRLGTTRIYLRQYGDAIAAFERAIKVGGGVALDFYNLGCALAMAGQTDKALDNLEKAIDAGFTSRQQFETDTDLDSLRQTERFKALLERLGADAASSSPAPAERVKIATPSGAVLAAQYVDAGKGATHLSRPSCGIARTWWRRTSASARPAVSAARLASAGGSLRRGGAPRKRERLPERLFIDGQQPYGRAPLTPPGPALGLERPRVLAHERLLILRRQLHHAPL